MSNQVSLNAFRFFPTELQLHILQFASTRDLKTTASCMQVCHEWLETIRNDASIWKSHFNRAFTNKVSFIAEEFEEDKNLTHPQKVRALLDRENSLRTEWITTLTQDLTVAGARLRKDLIAKLEKHFMENRGTFEYNLFKTLNRWPDYIIFFFLNKGEKYPDEKVMFYNHLLRVLLFTRTWNGKVYDERSVFNYLIENFPKTPQQGLDSHKLIIYFSLMMALLFTGDYGVEIDPMSDNQNEIFPQMVTLAQMNHGSLLFTFSGLLLVKELKVSHLIKGDLFKTNSQEHLYFIQSLIMDYLHIKKHQTLAFINYTEYSGLPVQVRNRLIEIGQEKERIFELLQESIDCIDRRISFANSPVKDILASLLQDFDSIGAPDTNRQLDWGKLVNGMNRSFSDEDVKVRKAKKQIRTLLEQKLEEVSKITGSKRKNSDEENSSSEKTQRQE